LFSVRREKDLRFYFGHFVLALKTMTRNKTLGSKERRNEKGHMKREKRIKTQED